MSEVMIAFYKGDGLLRDKFIRWWTGSIYSHVEIIMPNGTMAGISPPIYPRVRRKGSDDLDFNEWDFIKIPVTEEQVDAIKKFIDSTRGQGYDWIGMLASHVTPFKVRFPNKWYCSEWVAYALSVAKIITWRQAKLYNFARIPPGKLYNLLRKTRTLNEKN